MGNEGRKYGASLAPQAVPTEKEESNLLPLTADARADGEARVEIPVSAPAFAP